MTTDTPEEAEVRAYKVKIVKLLENSPVLKKRGYYFDKDSKENNQPLTMFLAMHVMAKI